MGISWAQIHCYKHSLQLWTFLASTELFVRRSRFQGCVMLFHQDQAQLGARHLGQGCYQWGWGPCGITKKSVSEARAAGRGSVVRFPEDVP